MKSQLVIIAALLVSAYALPVPDEEVSPVVQAAPQIQEKIVEQKTDEKIIDAAIKPAESRAAAETPAALLPETKKDEKLAAELPLNAPDAELPQSLPADKKELTKDKQTRADDKVVEEAKALPVTGAAAASSALPAGAAGIAEESKHADNAQPLIAAAAVEEPASIEGKSTIIADAAPAEQKKDELSAAEETPILKTEGKPELSADAAPAALPIALPAALAASAPAAAATEALKKDETPARQERVGESVNEVDAKVGHVAPVSGGVVAGAVAPAAASAAVVDADVVVPAVKSLPAEDSAPVAPAASASFIEPAKEHLKSAAIADHHHSAPAKAEALAQAPAGDISQQASEESGAAKALKSEETPAPAPEAKKVEELAAPAAAPVAAAVFDAEPVRKEIEAAKILEEKKQAAAEADIKKPSAVKDTDSSDSSESKESAESSEDKSN